MTWLRHPWQAWLTYRGLRGRQAEGKTGGARREAWQMTRNVRYVRLRKVAKHGRQ